MRNKILIIGIIIGFCLLTIIIIGSSLIQQTQKKLPSQNPTPTITTVIPTNFPFGQPIISTGPKELLRIISTTPSNTNTNIPLTQAIEITFNRPFSLSEIIFSITPSMTYDMTLSNNSLIITPRMILQPNTTYTYSIQFQNNTSQFSATFTTTNIAITPADAIPGINDQINKQSHPDIFLENRTPYSTSDFSLTGDFTNVPNEHYYFTVTLIGTNPNDSKQAFLNWVKSQGLTDTQIQSLDIRYQ